MKKGFTIICVCTLIITINVFCSNPKGDNTNVDSYPTVTDSLIIEKETLTTDNLPEVKLEPVFPSKFFNQNIQIFLEGLYREYEVEDLAHMKNEDWYDLRIAKNSSHFILEKSHLKIEKDTDDCMATGYLSTYVTSNDALMLIKGITTHDKKIKGFCPKNQEIIPDKKFEFSFNGIQYTLESECFFPSEREGYFFEKSSRAALNYKLYLVTKNKKELLMLIPDSNSDSFVQALFIGDLDEDGKPDFVFDTSLDYEEKRLMLYLSSLAKEGKMVAPIDEASYQFDC